MGAMPPREKVRRPRWLHRVARRAQTQMQMVRRDSKRDADDAVAAAKQKIHLICVQFVGYILRIDGALQLKQMAMKHWME
jgi:hypothetical protein